MFTVHLRCFTSVLREASNFLQSALWLALRFVLVCFFLFLVGFFGGGEYGRLTVGVLAERRLVDNLGDVRSDVSCSDVSCSVGSFSDGSCLDGSCSDGSCSDAVVDNADIGDTDEFGRLIVQVHEALTRRILTVEVGFTKTTGRVEGVERAGRTVRAGGSETAKGSFKLELMIEAVSDVEGASDSDANKIVLD